MANPEHLAILKQGVQLWNAWYDNSYYPVTPNLSEADLRQAELDQADLHKADLRKADLSAAHLHEANLYQADLRKAYLYWTHLSNADLNRAKLYGADLTGADLTGASLRGADLSKADLCGAILSEADMSGADLRGADLRNAYLIGTDLRQANLHQAILSEANLRGADLRQADLRSAILVRTNLDSANLSGASIFGISAWDVSLEGTTQKDLVIQQQSYKDPLITLDDLEVAQFIYLLLNNKRVRNVIDTITSKVVLILGRFTPERKTILDALRDELRRRNYLPVLFDFEKPIHRDLTETVSTLAHMARFVIADITDARSIPQELMAIVPTLPSVPVQPLLLASQREYGMFEHFRRFPWVLEPYLYEDQDRLLAAITEKVIGPAEAKAKEQTGR